MQSYLNILYIGKTPEYFEPLKQKENLCVTTVENNLTAVNYLNSNIQPDAIICDYNLTGQNGLQLFEWIRERPNFNATPFILLRDKAKSLSALKTFPSAEVIFTSGLNELYIVSTNPVKPFIPDKIIISAPVPTVTASTDIQLITVMALVDFFALK